MSQVKPDLLDVARQRENGKEGFTPHSAHCALASIHIHTVSRVPCVKCREDGVAS